MQQGGREGSEVQRLTVVLIISCFIHPTFTEAQWKSQSLASEQSASIKI